MRKQYRTGVLCITIGNTFTTMLSSWDYLVAGQHHLRDLPLVQKRQLEIALLHLWADVSSELAINMSRRRACTWPCPNSPSLRLTLIATISPTHSPSHRNSPPPISVPHLFQLPVWSERSPLHLRLWTGGTSIIRDSIYQSPSPPKNRNPYKISLSPVQTGSTSDTLQAVSISRSIHSRRQWGLMGTVSAPM